MPPIPHPELLTLSELVQKAGVSMATATNRLAGRGITNMTAVIVVQELAAKNARSAQQIYQVILAEPARGAGGSGHGQEQGRGGFGGGGNGGSGPGRKTLSQFCTDEGIDLKATLARLEAKGIKASADLTMREIAVNNGYTRPYELMDVIRSK